jgi:hypothetical protein
MMSEQEQAIRLLVVIPVFNEAAVIAVLLQKLMAALPNHAQTPHLKSSS